jgi:hypothetical protein
MNQVIEQEQKNVIAAKVTKPTAWDRFEIILYHLVAVFAWFYAITKLFMIDIDVYLVKSINPNLLWILDYKFFAFVAFAAVSLLFASKMRIVFSVLFISFYPIVIIFYVAYYIFKSRNWMVMVAIFNTIVSAFSNFRLRFFLFALTVISFACIYASLDQRVLAAAAGTLIALNFVEYTLAITSAFKTSKVTKFYNKIPDWGASAIKHAATNEQLKGVALTNMTSTQLTLYRSNLQSALLANKACLFSATILREYKKSGFPTISGAVATLGLFIFTVISFAAINYAVFAIDIDAYSYEKGAFPSAFTFFHYSFNNMIFSSIKELSPVADSSYAIEITQRALFIFLSIVFVSLLVTTQRQKFTEELDEVIARIKRSGAEMEDYIYHQFGVATWDDALTEIRKMEASFVELLLFFTRNIDL